MKSSFLSFWCTLRSMWWRLLFILPLLHRTQWCHWLSASTSFVSSSSAFFLTGFWTLAAFFLYTATGLTGCWTLAVLARTRFAFFWVSASTWTLAVFLFRYRATSVFYFPSAYCYSFWYFLGRPLAGETKHEWTVNRCTLKLYFVVYAFPHVEHCRINQSNINSDQMRNDDFRTKWWP